YLPVAAFLVWYLRTICGRAWHFESPQPPFWDWVPQRPVDSDWSIALPVRKLAFSAIEKRRRTALQLGRLPNEEMNRDAELNVVRKFLLDVSGTVLLVLALPLKSTWTLEPILVAMLLRLGGLVERDEQHDRVVLEDEALVPD